MALANSLRDIVHSVARLKFGGEKIFKFALVDGELADAVRQFFHGHWVLIVLPAEFRFGHGFRFGQYGGGRHQFTDHRLFFVLQLFSRSGDGQAVTPCQRQDLLGAAEAGPITMVS